MSSKIGRFIRSSRDCRSRTPTPSGPGCTIGGTWRRTCERAWPGWGSASATEPNDPGGLPEGFFGFMLRRGLQGETMTTAAAPNSLDFEKPLLSEVDIYGCTHVGRVRKTNADHFLIAT